ncbi:hypothetical protein [Streptomyces sp. bgisy032]|uniref:hypothetical protein n=1 Tax=Streptomyces sp. bgisy032 TaxID=3413773 RepID=UPI003D760AA2
MSTLAAVRIDPEGRIAELDGRELGLTYVEYTPRLEYTPCLELPWAGCGRRP